MSLCIHTATPDEYAAVAERASPPTPRSDDDHHYVEVLRDVGARAAEAELLVATDEDLLGTVTYVPEGGPFGEIAGPDETEFRMLAVAPEAQGRGVGSALLRHVLDEGARDERRSSARASRRCAPHTTSMNGSGSPACPSATGRPCRASTCSRSA